MKLIKFLTTDENGAAMQAAAEYMELPLSSWARITLIEAARSSAHKKLCATGKEPDVTWKGKPCTKEQFDRWTADAVAYEKRLADERAAR